MGHALFLSLDSTQLDAVSRSRMRPVGRRMVDIVMIRTFDQKMIEQFAAIHGCRLSMP
ncbi:MAG: hypothetical protein R3E89_18620 [Thiolinea sp.]